MILISKHEKNNLEKLGCKFHQDLFKTYSRYPKYYLKETNRNLEKLNKIRTYK